MNNVITSKENPKIKEALAAKEGKSDFFLIEGFHTLEMALKAKAVERIYSVAPYSCGIENILVTPELLKKMASTLTPEGIVALCHPLPSQPFSGDRLLYLDGVQDPGNVGTLLRTALAFGYHDVLLGKGCASLLSSKVLLASQGALFSLNAHSSEGSVLEDVESLKAAGYYLVATDLKSAVPPKQIPLDKKLALLLGNEARGLEKEAIAKSDIAVRIEMDGIDSLNVGVAGGILMYELRKN